MTTTTNDDATKVLSEILQQRLSKSPDLAAKQRRLLELLQKPTLKPPAKT